MCSKEHFALAFRISLCLTARNDISLIKADTNVSKSREFNEYDHLNEGRAKPFDESQC